MASMMNTSLDEIMGGMSDTGLETQRSPSVVTSKKPTAPKKPTNPDNDKEEAPVDIKIDANLALVEDGVDEEPVDKEAEAVLLGGDAMDTDEEIPPGQRTPAPETSIDGSEATTAEGDSTMEEHLPQFVAKVIMDKT